ncbi:MAG TPA: ATP-binding cassette domain-containing protein, partial [Methylibium sp.]
MTTAALRAAPMPFQEAVDAANDAANNAATTGRRIGDVVLEVQNISLAFGGVKALTDISFNVREHEIRAIIGPNGAGKSSMLNCINGVYQPQQGSITFRGRHVKHMNSRQVAEMGVAR